MITAQKRYLFMQTAFTILCLTIFILFIVNSNEVSNSICASIDLCTNTIIPSLFPFFIISELMISGNIANWIGKIFRKPCNILLGISGMSAFPILMGTLCGFPIGAKLVVSFFEKGYISKKEAERTLCYCNNPSPAFLINAVGGILYSNKKIGIVLLCTTLVTSIIIGIFCNFMFGKTYKDSPSIYFNQQTKIPEITKLIEECVMPILKICAYIIFFSALMGCIKNIMVHFNINNSLQAMLYGIIELSGGTQAISLLNKNVFSMCLLSFAIGWSGLSVHLQIMSMRKNNAISVKPYIIAKFIQGIVNAIIVCIICIFCPHALEINDIYIPTYNILYTSFFKNMVVCIFIVMSLLLLYKKFHKTSFTIIY